MVYFSFVGIILAVCAFVFLAFKGVNMLFNSMVASVIIMLTSNLAVLESIKNLYMAGFSGFMKGYFLLFALSALFGKAMTDSGAARKIALTLAGFVKKSKGNKKFLTVLILPVFYTMLSYAGVSGFVVVFTVLSIGRELFEECDVPWKYYCYGSAGIYPALVLGGSLYATNIIPISVFNTEPTAGFLLSLICFSVAWITIILLLKLDINKSEKNGEGFLPTGAPIKALQIEEQMSEEKLPTFGLSILSMVVPIICIIVFKADVLLSLSIATAVNFILFNKKFPSIKNTLSAGITSSAKPIIYVAGAVGFTTLIKAAPGFTIVIDFIQGLPPVIAGVSMVMLVTAIVASSSSSLPTFLPEIANTMMATGLSTATSHRLVSLSCCTYMMPHNAGVVNAISLTKLDYKKAAWIYFKTTTLPGICSVAVAVILVSLGIFS